LVMLNNKTLISALSTLYIQEFYTGKIEHGRLDKKGGLLGIMQRKPRNNIILGGAIGNCVHVAGAYTYLQLAESVGYQTIFLGAAASPERWIDSIAKHDPAIVGIGYRLTPLGTSGDLR